MRKILLLILILLNIQIKAQCWKTIAVGGSHTVAIKNDGSLWAWGYNGVGQLGDSSNINKNIPTLIGTTKDWQAVATGETNTIAIKTDGTLWAWGNNFFGELGDGTNINKNTPTQIGTTTDWKTVTAGGYHIMAIKKDGSLWAWGYNKYGQLGDETTVNKNIPTQIGTAKDWQTITAGYDYTVALKTDGTLWTWGNNYYGRLGDGTQINSSIPKKIGTATDWKTIAAGSSHTVATKTDGTLWTWGSNISGQLGNGTVTNNYTPIMIGTSTNWESITAGSGYTLGVKTDGTLWAWGSNITGTLGDGKNSDSYTPKQIGTTNNWQTVSAHSLHTAALKKDFTLLTWGRNSYGQLGDGTSTDKNTPTLINCPESLTITTTQTNEACAGLGSASITSVSGGTTPYNYLWSNGATTNSITGLTAGNYSCTITDASGASIIKNFTITVEVDTQKPSISYMPNITVNTNLNCTATNVSLGTPVTSDNCSVVSVTNNAPSAFPLGNTKVTWTVKDASNNVATITQSVTVNDVTKPTITAPPTVIVNADSNGTATGVTLGTPITADNCSVSSVTNNAPTTFLSGNTTVTWTVKDASNNIATATQIVTVIGGNPTTLIPDINFEKKLIALGIDSGTTDGKVLTSAVSSLISLDVSFASISNLTGIEDFVALKVLDCNSNKLTTLDLSKNSALTSLDCSYNNLLNTLDISKNSALTSLKSNGNFKLTTFDVSKNLALTDLECNNVNLTTLDVSANTSLSTLRCFNNQLTTLDITKNKALKVLNCYSNQLSAIDVSNNIVLDTLSCNSNKLITLDISKNINLKRLNCSNNKLESLNLKNGNNLNLEITNSISRFLYNPDLVCIQVDNKNYSDANWSLMKNATANYSENCPPKNILISSEFEDKLIALGIDKDGKNGAVLSAAILNTTTLDLSNSGISDLSGIEYFINLENLICKGNSLSTIDISKNTALKYLDCSNNPLTTLDVSKNILLEELYCDGVVSVTNKTISSKTTSTNQITTLDLSNNLFLTKLSCSNNQITNLDLSKNSLLTDINCSKNNLQILNLNNGNNVKITTINLKNNSSLYCVKVDNFLYSNTNWAEAKDPIARYSENCDATLVLSSNNFTVESKGETCLNENNGVINITAKANYNYVANINGTDYTLTNNTLAVSNLAPATYTIRITIPGQYFEQNFSVTIPRVTTITGKSTVSSRLASVEITEGTSPYTIFINGEEQFKTTSETFSVAVNKGDFLEVKTAKACEGIYLKEINTGAESSILAHPNPTKGEFTLEVPASIKNINIDVYTADSKIISSETKSVTNGQIKLNIENQPAGIYYVKIYLNTPKYLKIIKK